MNILVVGAHPDDIEIGCLGTILSTKGSNNFYFFVCSSTPLRKQEFLASCEALQNKGVSILSVECLSHSDCDLFSRKSAIKDQLRKFEAKHKADFVLTHFKHDRHQDHRLVFEVTTEVCRNHNIFSYEIPKYDGCSFAPSVYEPISEGIAAEKVKHLMSYYESQHTKNWYKTELFYAQLTLRGIEIKEKYAEAFIPVKVRMNNFCFSSKFL